MLVLNLFIVVLQLIIILLLLISNSSIVVINCDRDASGRVLLHLGSRLICFVVVVWVVLLLLIVFTHSLHPVMIRLGR